MHMSSQSEPKSFSDIIDLWADAPSFASACNSARAPSLRGKLSNVTRNNVRVWKSRNTIPPRRFEEVAGAATTWGFTGVTLAALTALYKARYPDQDAGAALAAEFS